MKKLSICTLSLLTFSTLTGISSCNEVISTSSSIPTSEVTTSETTSSEPSSSVKQAHAITFTESEDFSVECELTEAKEGDKVSFTIVLNNDHTEITAVKVYNETLTANNQ